MEIFILTKKDRFGLLFELIKHLKSWKAPPKIAVIFHEWCNEYEDLDVRLIHSPSERQFVKANVAISSAETEWLVITHDDDILLENTYELFEIANGSDYSLVVGHATSFGLNYEYWNQMHMEKYAHFLVAAQMNFVEAFFIYGNPIVFSGAVLNKNKIEISGGFNENYSHFGDIDLWLRLSKTGKFQYVDIVNLHYRLHLDQVSSKNQLLARLEMRHIYSKFSNNKLHGKNDLKEKLKDFFAFLMSMLKLNCDDLISFLKLKFSRSDK